MRQPEYIQKKKSWKQEERSEGSHSTSYWEQKQSGGTYKKKPEAEARNVQYPISAIRGQSLPEFAEAIGNHGRILKKRAGTYEDQHIDMVIIFMSSSTKATIHLGQNFIENMTVCKNIDVEEIQDLFSITQRLVWDHSEEIQNVKVTESTDCSWTRTKLSHRQVIKRTKGKSPCILRLCTMS